jgi:hypothetical protein
MSVHGSYNVVRSQIPPSGAVASTSAVSLASVAASSGAASFRRLSPKPEKMPTPHVCFVGTGASKTKEAQRRERVQKHMKRVQKHLSNKAKLRGSQKKELTHSLRVLGQMGAKHGFTLEYALDDTFAAFAHTAEENLQSIDGQLKKTTDKDLLHTVAGQLRPKRISKATDAALENLQKELDSAEEKHKAEIRGKIKDLEAKKTQFEAVGKLRNGIGGLSTVLDEEVSGKQQTAEKRDAILGIADDLHKLPSDDAKALAALRKAFDKELTDAGISKGDNAARTKGALIALDKFLELAQSAEGKYIEGGMALRETQMRKALRFKPEELERLKGLVAGHLDQAGIKQAADTAKADMKELHVARGETGYDLVAPGTPGHAGAVRRLIGTLETLSAANNPKELVALLEDSAGQELGVGRYLFQGTDNDQALKEGRAAEYLKQLLDLYTQKRREAVQAYSEINQISSLSMSSSLQARREALTNSVKVFSPFTPEKMSALRERIGV